MRDGPVSEAAVLALETVSVAAGVVLVRRPGRCVQAQGTTICATGR
jgi:hypothetical protein